MSDFLEIVELIYDTPNKSLLEDLLLGLTTDKERQELVMRIEIVKRLLAGEPQHAIAADLGVGVATVTRGSKELSQGRFKVLQPQHSEDDC
jgi:TrpR family transcriptional regulator, trp operon repressor